MEIITGFSCSAASKSKEFIEFIKYKRLKPLRTQTFLWNTMSIYLNLHTAVETASKQEIVYLTLHTAPKYDTAAVDTASMQARLHQAANAASMQISG